MTGHSKGGQSAAEPAPAPRPVDAMTEAEIEGEMSRLQVERTDRVSRHNELWLAREKAAQSGLSEQVAELDAERLRFRNECRALADLVGRRYHALDAQLTELFAARGVRRVASPPHGEYWGGMS